MPKGVAVRIRARASRRFRHCSSGVELSIRNRAVVGSNPTSGSPAVLPLHLSLNPDQIAPPPQYQQQDECGANRESHSTRDPQRFRSLP